MRETFILFLLLIQVVSGQKAAPGGVYGAELWLKTAVADSANLNGLYKYQDFSGDSAGYNHYDARGAGYGTQYTLARDQIRMYNFNPSMDMTEVGGSKEILLKYSNLSQSTILGVFGPEYADYNQDMLLYSVNGRKDNGYLMTKGRIVKSTVSGQPPLEYGTEQGKNLYYNPQSVESDLNEFMEKSLRSLTYMRSTRPNYTVWGERSSSVISSGYIYFPENVNNTSAFNTQLFNNRIFWGYTPELIVYGRILTPLERRKIETYFAVKYGFTLDLSYLSSSGELIWDLEANKGYHTRIAGIGRDDAGGLYQKLATTSYAEAPYHNAYDDVLYDSHDLNNSYMRSSRYKLLVSGLQYGSPLADGEYILWGDNDETISAVEQEQLAGMKLMSRRWLLRTNKSAPGEEKKKTGWDISGLQVNEDGFKSTLIKKSTDLQNEGSMVTQSPLLQKDGYLAYKVTDPLVGQVNFKFGTQQPRWTEDSYDYGYQVDLGVYVYRMVKGRRSGGIVHVLGAGQKIEIEKTGMRISLRMNGTILPAADIVIASEDSDKSYYGSVFVQKGVLDLTLSDFRYGGFSDTGNFVELSYVTKDPGFYPNRNQGYLLVDRSGSGEFKQGQVDYYPVSELDEPRYKIIFNNVYWDTDGNGKDIFTFGYRESNIIAELETEDPTCDAQGNPLENGTIDILIQRGYKGFYYSLKDKNTTDNTLLKEGFFYSDTLQITEIPAGEYTLALQEIGGTNLIRREESSDTEILQTSYAAPAVGTMEWTLIEDGNFEIGYGLMSSGVIRQGAAIENGKLYAIINGEKNASPLADAAVKDKISIEKTTTALTYKVNAEEVGKQAITDAVYYGIVKMNSVQEIVNLKAGGFPADMNWQGAGSNLAVEKSSSDRISKDILLTDNCFPSVESPVLESRSQNMVIYYPNQNSTKEAAVRVALEAPLAATLLVYDLNARLVTTIEHTQALSEHEFELTGLPSGVYVLKVITYEAEYTGRIIIN